MKTTNGYNYIKRGTIVTLIIPLKEGMYCNSVQLAKREILLTGENISEIKIKKS
jgi:hypothetical protein